MDAQATVAIGNGKGDVVVTRIGESMGRIGSGGRDSIAKVPEAGHSCGHARSTGIGESYRSTGTNSGDAGKEIDRGRG